MRDKKKRTLIAKHDITECWACRGNGYLNTPATTCPTCDGTGTWIEKHYIIVDNKNKIAFDCDNGA